MTSPLTHCGACSKPFKEDAYPKLPEPLMFTVCFHIFHQTCLGNWINASGKSCPYCRAPVYKLQAGKDFNVYWNIFLTALKSDPDIVHIVLETLTKADHTNHRCIAECLQDLPLTPLRYNAQTKQLVHESCGTSQMPPLLMQDLANIVKKIVAKDPWLQKKLTPTPSLWFWQRVFSAFQPPSR